MKNARVYYLKFPKLWVAEHLCREEEGWSETLDEWHNAFTAAYHHVRYDCLKRTPSSGQWVVWPENKGGMEKHPYPIYDSLFTQELETMEEDKKLTGHYWIGGREVSYGEWTKYHGV